MFYKKRVLGQYGKPFTILKIRTMEKDADKRLSETVEANGVEFFMNGSDPRITKLGSFLRPRRIDEFPQLINYFAGQMDLIGTRARSEEDWTLRSKEHMELCLSYRPGLFPSHFYRDVRDLRDIIDAEKEYYMRRNEDPDIDRIYFPAILRRFASKLR